MRLPWLLLAVVSAHASLPPAPPAPIDAVTTAVQVRTRSAEAQQVLGKILTDDAWWSDATRQTFDDQLYDELRLKSTDTGYVPMITGEGNEDFPHQVVADTVYFRNLDLPKYMSGAKVIQVLGSGYDKTVGAEYRDCFYILDLTAFYGYFPQRMYWRHDNATNTTVLWFEKLNSTFVDAATWTVYQQKMQFALDHLERRWALNALIEVTDVYGMFVVEPGKVHTSRVSFVSKITFGEGTGWVAQWGSQIPGVIRAGIKSGFDASVAIARKEKAKLAAAQPPPALMPSPPPTPPTQ
jgi:hypothetical protein